MDQKWNAQKKEDKRQSIRCGSHEKRSQLFLTKELLQENELVNNNISKSRFISLKHVYQYLILPHKAGTTALLTHLSDENTAPGGFINLPKFTQKQNWHSGSLSSQENNLN